MNYFFIVYFIISFIVALCFLFKTKSKKNFISVLIILVFFPIFGIFLIMLFFAYKKYITVTEIDYEQLLHKNQDHHEFYNDLNFDDEINVLPINDILQISDNSIKQKSFLNLVKKDAYKYIDYIKIALDNTDSETSHYAAATIQEIKRKMEEEIKEILIKLEDENESIEYIKEYADILYLYISNDLIDAFQREKYFNKYIELLIKIIDNECYEEKYIVNAINLFLISDKINEAKKFGKIYFEKYPETINKYIVNMKIFYNIYDIKNFNKMLNGMRESELIFDDNTLDKVRFWIGW